MVDPGFSRGSRHAVLELSLRGAQRRTNPAFEIVAPAASRWSGRAARPPMFSSEAKQISCKRTNNPATLLLPRRVFRRAVCSFTIHNHYILG